MSDSKWLSALPVLLLLGACASTAPGATRTLAASDASSQAAGAETRPAAAASSQQSRSETQIASGEPEIEQVREVAAASSGGDELVCRRVTRAGSHLPVRLCETRAEIEAARRAATELMRERSAGRSIVLESEGPE